MPNNCANRLNLGLVVCWMSLGIYAIPSIAQAPPSGMSLADSIQYTIRHHPTLKAAAQDVLFMESVAQMHRSAFDTYFQTSVGHQRETVAFVPSLQSTFGDFQSTDQTDFIVGSSTTTQWGTTITPGVSLSRTGIAYESDDYGDEPAVNAAALMVSIKQPLLRNMGRIGQSGEYMAARVDVERAHLVRNFTAQVLGYSAAQAYWHYVFAQRAVENLEVSAQRMTKMVEDVEFLVKEGQRPEADLTQIRAQRSQRFAQVIQAKNARITAKRTLAKSMGMSFEEAQSLPPPVDSIPELSETIRSQVLDTQPYVDNALTRRRDIQAQERWIERTEIVRRMYKQNRLPSLDLSVNMGYIGLVAENQASALFSAIGKNVKGASGGASLTFELPFQNNAARAAHAQKEVEYRKGKLQLYDMTRAVSMDVELALESLRNSMEEVKYRSRTVDFYRTAVDGERVKWMEGMSTIIDILVMEDRLTTAQIDALRARRNYAVALTTLAFSTGSFPESETFETANFVDTMQNGSWINEE